MPRNGLVVSGGSAKGAFAAGAIGRLQERFGLTFDLVSGTSTGALIAPLIVTGELSLLEELYSTLSARDLLLERPPLDVVRQGSLYDLAGLRRILQDLYTVDRVEKILNSPRQMFITTVNLQTGRVVFFHTGPDPRGYAETDLVRITGPATLLDAVMASAMQPALMPAVPIKSGGVNHQFVDGGIRETVPIRIVIENGATDVFVITLTAENEGGDEHTFTSLVTILKRTIELFCQETVRSDIAIAELYNEAVVYQETLRRALTQALPGNDGLIDQAFKDTQEANPFATAQIVKLFSIRPAGKLCADALHFSTGDMQRMLRLGRERVDDLYPNGLEPMSPPVIV